VGVAIAAPAADRDLLYLHAIYQLEIRTCSAGFLPR